MGERRSSSVPVAADSHHGGSEPAAGRRARTATDHPGKRRYTGTDQTNHHTPEAHSEARARVVLSTNRLVKKRIVNSVPPTYAIAQSTDDTRSRSADRHRSTSSD